MKRKLIQAGGFLAVTLPSEVVKEYQIEKGMSFDVPVHPKTGAVSIRPRVRLAEEGEVTEQFERTIDRLLERRAKLYRRLAE